MYDDTFINKEYSTGLTNKNILINYILSITPEIPQDDIKTIMIRRDGKIYHGVHFKRHDRLDPEAPCREDRPI